MSDYDSLSTDSKEAELIDINSQKDENMPIKNDSNDKSFNDSMEQMNSLIVKEKPLTNKYSNIKAKNRKGNTYMFLFDKNGSPKIVIGLHCKKIKYKNIYFYRDIHYMSTIFCCFSIFTILYWIMGFFKLLC